MEPHLKNKLYRFLNMRNKLYMICRECRGGTYTRAGRQIAKEFLAELCIAAVSISGLMIALQQVYAKDELGIDLLDDLPDGSRQFAELVQKQLGPMARKMLDADIIRRVLCLLQRRPKRVL